MGSYLNGANEELVMKKLKSRFGKAEISVNRVRGTIQEVLDCHHPGTITLMHKILCQKGLLVRAGKWGFKIQNIKQRRMQDYEARTL